MIEPLRLSFDVDCSIEHAFTVWTARIDGWWLADHTVTGEPGSIVVLEPRVWRNRNRAGWQSLLPYYRGVWTRLPAVAASVIAASARSTAVSGGTTSRSIDNGPELIAHALVHWCRYSGVDPAYIDPASPWQNGVCESFNGRFRDEFLVCEQFDTLLEVQVLAEDWRTEYNTYRPHGSLDVLTPEALRQRWITNRQPTLA
ncbi:integrase core domain-containing protein [Micromonospora sp. DT47]|uniref:integrase core domain-containing protein n=1 Tax=Micromonospora sp. DT47 TaxID=3393431 RepID=UPI003CEE9255